MNRRLVIYSYISQLWQSTVRNCISDSFTQWEEWMAFQDVFILVQHHFFFSWSNKAKGNFKSAGRNYNIFSGPCDLKSIWKGSVPVSPRRCLDNIHHPPKRHTKSQGLFSLNSNLFQKTCQGGVKKISKPNSCIAKLQSDKERMNQITRPMLHVVQNTQS